MHHITSLLADDEVARLHFFRHLIYLLSLAIVAVLLFGIEADLLS